MSTTLTTLIFVVQRLAHTHVSSHKLATYTFKMSCLRWHNESTTELWFTVDDVPVGPFAARVSCIPFGNHLLLNNSVLETAYPQNQPIYNNACYMEPLDVPAVVKHIVWNSSLYVCIWVSEIQYTVNHHNLLSSAAICKLVGDTCHLTASLTVLIGPHYTMSCYL